MYPLYLGLMGYSCLTGTFIRQGLVDILFKLSVFISFVKTKNSGKYMEKLKVRIN